MHVLVASVVAHAVQNPFAGVLDRFGPAGVFLFVLLENLGAPIPGETMLVATSAYAAAGHINIALVVGFCIAGVWSGSTLSYLAGRRGGMPLLRRLRIPERHLDRAAVYTSRWGSQTVFLGRYVAFLRSYLGWLAGINAMDARVFLAWNLIGTVAWTLTFATLGYLLGDHWTVIEGAVRTLGYGAIVVGIVLVVAYVLLHRRLGGKSAK